MKKLNNKKLLEIQAGKQSPMGCLKKIGGGAAVFGATGATATAPAAGVGALGGAVIGANMGAIVGAIHCFKD